MPLSAPSVVANEAQRPNVLADKGALVWSKPSPPYSSGMFALISRGRCFLHQFARQLPIVMLELVDARIYFVVDKLTSRLGDHAMFFSEVFRCEDIFSRSFFNQERATFDDFFCSTTADMSLSFV